MSNLVSFAFKNNNVRVIEKEGEPWFVGKDVAAVLGYSDTSQAIRTHCKGGVDFTAPSSGGIQVYKVIPERDVYRLIMRSKKAEAQFEE